MTTYYHGTCEPTCTPHEGMCLTTSVESARQYAGDHSDSRVYAVQVSGDLHTESISGYDHETNDAPADSAAFRASLAARGIDIVTYDDEDERGRVHDCVRLISQRAVDAATMVAM